VLTEENEEITIKESIDEEIEDLGTDLEAREDMEFVGLPIKGEVNAEEDLYNDYDESDELEDFEEDIQFDEIVIEEESEFVDDEF
jgi:DNA-directed RNA polymerase subunit beta